MKQGKYVPNYIPSGLLGLTVPRTKEGTKRSFRPAFAAGACAPAHGRDHRSLPGPKGGGGGVEGGSRPPGAGPQRARGRLGSGAILASAALYCHK